MFSVANELYSLACMMKQTSFLKNILYHYEFLSNRLIIRRFTQIANSTKILINEMRNNEKILANIDVQFSNDVKKLKKFNES